MWLDSKTDFYLAFLARVTAVTEAVDKKAKTMIGKKSIGAITKDGSKKDAQGAEKVRPTCHNRVRGMAPVLPY